MVTLPATLLSVLLSLLVDEGLRLLFTHPTGCALSVVPALLSEGLSVGIQHS